MKNSKYILLGIAAIVCAVVLARAYTYKYRSQDTIVVTGLGETEFTSDLIVWSGTLTAEAENVAAGYARIEQSKQKVQKYLADKGVPAEAVVFAFVNVDKQYTPVYNASGNWAGQRFAGYQLRQRFTVESSDVEKVETISREISSLIAQGVSIEAYAPDYYYTKLDDVKMGLIEKASADARLRAEKIAVNAGAKIGSVSSARMGVFQITGANSNEEFSAGGSFNTANRNKKARITMRIEYRIKYKIIVRINKAVIATTFTFSMFFIPIKIQIIISTPITMHHTQFPVLKIPLAESAPS